RCDVADPVPLKNQEGHAQSTERCFELLLEGVGRVHLHLAAPRCNTGGERRNPALADPRVSVLTPSVNDADIPAGRLAGQGPSDGRGDPKPLSRTARRPYYAGSQRPEHHAGTLFLSISARKQPRPLSQLGARPPACR